MKKLTILIALALCFTVGGVYATWNYAQGNVSVKTEYIDAQLADKVVETAKGVININLDNISVVIDDTNNDHIAELVIDGYIEVTFTPSSGADDAVTNNGIPLQFALSVTNDWKFDGTDIFALSTTDPVALNDGNATKSVRIEASTLASMVTLGGEIKLDTVSDYQTFHALIHSGYIGVTVSEITA